MLRNRHLIFFSLALVLFAHPAHGQDGDRLGKKHVLLLNSYNKGYTWTDAETAGVEAVFAPHPDIVLRVEYMDAKILNSDAYYQRLKDLYALKYARHPFDVIVSTDDDAFNFLVRYRDEVFANTPVVFCGVNDFDPSRVAGFPLCTGVNESADFRANLALMARLHPGGRRVVVINDSLTTARSLRAEFDAAAAGFKERFEFVHVDDIPMEDLLDRLKRLPGDSLAFYLSFFRDGAGRAYAPEEALPAIAAAAPVPVYGAVDYMLGNGIVGGMLKSSRYQGETAARLALRILRGEPVGAIPVVTASPNQYMFDYRRLKPFGIRLSELPAGSLIVNEPQTFYYKYRKMIWAAFGVFSTMALYIVFLLFNIRKRIRAQRGLQSIIGMTASIFDYHSLKGFKAELVARLSTLLPLKSDLRLFKCVSNPGGREKTLVPVDAEPETDAAAADAGLSPQAEELIACSMREERCLVKRRDAVAFIRSDYSPGRLVFFRGRKYFDALDRDLLEIFANTISMSIENLQKLRIEESLETARRIQMSMLPTSFGEFSRKFDLDLFAYLLPAREVGGDFYDFFAIDETRLCVTVGDVSDKGIPAALFMSMTKSLIRVAAEGNPCPERILARVNDELSRENEQSMFVTVFVAVLDLGTGRLAYATAGHSPPYIMEAGGGFRKLTTPTDVALGIVEGAAYRSRETRLGPGEGLFLYTDGVTEAANGTGEFFDEKNLEAVLGVNGGGASKALIEAVTDSLRGFVADAPQSDDITMLCIRRNGHAR